MQTPRSETAYQAPAFTNGYEFSQGSGYSLPEYEFVVPPELSSGRAQRYPIVIVGAGISGLTLACALARLKVSVVVLDEDNTVGVRGASSRGICYTQKSLEVFQRLGIYERIAARGIQWSVGRTFSGNDEVYSFDLRQQAGFGLSRQPAFITIQQFYVEGYLVERIQELGSTDLRWQSRVSGFEQGAGFATLTVQTPAGSYRLEAEHVIDASGSHTPFHGWCGAAKEVRHGDDRWCIADVRFQHRPPTERHTWIEAPFNDNRAVWQHLMADEVWRIDYQMAPNADPEFVSRESEVRARLRRQFGEDVQCELVWVGPYAYRSQCLERLRHGSVFFMGDTAKIVNPFGARGGNSGIADADNLAWKLAAVHHRLAPAALLRSYDEERLQAAQENVRVTRRTARFLRAADGIERTFRSAAIGLAKKYTFARALINTGRMAVANQYTRSGICSKGGGSSVQNVPIHWPDDSEGCLNDLLTWADSRLLLLVFGPLDKAIQAHLRQISRHMPVRCVQVSGASEPAQALEHVRNARGLLRQTCQLGEHRWALVRPDSYLAATGERVNAGLVHAIERALALR